MQLSLRIWSMVKGTCRVPRWEVLVEYRGERYLSSTEVRGTCRVPRWEVLVEYRGERYLSSTKGICSPRLEHIFTKRSLGMTAHVDFLLTCSTGSCTRMPPSIIILIHRVIQLNECPFSNPLGVAGRGKPPPKIAGIGHSVRMEPKGKIWHCLGAIPINNCTFSHPLRVAGRGNPLLKLLALVIPWSGNPMGTFYTVFALAPFS